MTLCLRMASGHALTLHRERWDGRPPGEEQDLLARLEGPVLDVGCGPGRHALALNEQGVLALGIDASPAAVAHARSRGATVLERSIFDRVPGAGRWRTALLLDGNIGIGGDPAALLRRLVTLLHPTGAIAVELEGSGVGIQRMNVRVEDERSFGPWFPWARVGVDGVGALATLSAVDIVDLWVGGGRWFALLRPATTQRRVVSEEC